ncbi:unnamed protein product [Cutaneotrichosporon oleaginosum]
MTQPTPTTPPPLPTPLATLSVWQRTVASHPLHEARAHAPLPARADVVVIGGGLCGALVSHALLFPEEHPPSSSPSAAAAAASLAASSYPSDLGSSPSCNPADTPAPVPSPSIVLLEARTLASGASGRNAGHCRPDAGRGFPMYAGIHGEQEAVRILESEAEALRRTDAFITRHAISCEWSPRPTYDVHLSSAFAASSASAHAAYAAAGGPTPTFLDAAAASAATVPCLGATAWRAATLNPAQLTLGVVALCEADERFAAYTHAPVCSVTRESGGWAVRGPRGCMWAKKVVWATNAYGAGPVRGLVAPQGAQAHKIPPAPAPNFPVFEGSYSLRRSADVFYSVAPRPDGSIVLGASRGSWPAHLIAANQGCTDDSGWHPAVADAACRSWAALFPSGGWSVDANADADNPGGMQGAEAWTGIIGFTRDMVPLVGEVEGQYVAVGYCGHGMARMFVTAPALARYIRTGEWDAAMPASFRVTPQRLARLRL